MIDTSSPSPGTLIKLRGRRWVVLPSQDEDILQITPLGGSDKEATGIFLPLNSPADRWEHDVFEAPTLDDLDDFISAKVLFDASRLSFRNAAGPFRCAAKLSFRPRSYQMIPLVMALKQDKVRLVIADDVGIGKTIEALLIAREMLERGDIKSFAVLAPPHLCQQWNQEIHDKLGLDSAIIRPGTLRSLERQMHSDQSVFSHFPYQVISIDYIKNSSHKGVFSSHCPDLIIVDEAHTCTLPAGATSPSQQQRYHFLHDLIKNKDPHRLFLTATPHSGKNEEFAALLGLADTRFAQWDFEHLSRAERQALAKHFVLRKRDNIRRWLGQDTTFPKRDSAELGYSLSAPYLALFEEARRFARQLTSELSPQQRGHYWAVLALLRGIMSSPAAGIRMLENRLQKSTPAEQPAAEDDNLLLTNPLLETLDSTDDTEESALLDAVETSHLKQLRALKNTLETLHGLEHDAKVRVAARTVKQWVKEGFCPIVFCHYKATANYVGDLLRQELGKKVHVAIITSDKHDEQRREEIEAMAQHPQRVLVATDCLSEGINLQEYFTAVLHYDLPWNPNRLEQREGRVDRFGQTASLVKTLLLFGSDNAIDATVMEVLLRKVREIQRTTGVSITLGESNRSIMDAVLQKVLLADTSAVQPRLDLGMEDAAITNELESIRDKASNLRSIFAQESIKPEEIEAALAEMDEAIGDVQSVEHLVRFGAEHLGGRVTPHGEGWMLHRGNMPQHIYQELSLRDSIPISFDSPTPQGYRYMGRNHRFTELLCQYLLALSLGERDNYPRVARASVIRTNAVSARTVVYLLRLRNVVREAASKRESISEEIYLRGMDTKGNVLDYAACKKLLFEARSNSQIDFTDQQIVLQQFIDELPKLKSTFNDVSRTRAQHQVEMHSHFSSLVGGKRFEAVQPVLPADVLGIYVFSEQ